MKWNSITDATLDPGANWSSCGLNVSFSLINEVASVTSSGLHLANSEISLYGCICWRGSAKVQTSIQPQGNSFTPHSSPELTQFCYLYMLNSMTGLSLAMGRVRVCAHVCLSVCVCVRVCNSTSVTNKLGCCSLAHWETPTASSSLSYPGVIGSVSALVLLIWENGPMGWERYTHTVGLNLDEK